MGGRPFVVLDNVGLIVPPGNNNQQNNRDYLIDRRLTW